MCAMKSVVRSAKNFAKGYSEIQIKVREATSNDPSGPSGLSLVVIADATFNKQLFMEAFYILDKRLNDHGKNWRHVYKALVVLDHLLRYGSDAVVEYAKENIHVIKTLKEFQYIDENGRDQGINVRQKCKEVTSFLLNDELLRSERAKYANGGVNSSGNSERDRFTYKEAVPSGFGSHNYDDDDDDELQRALNASKRTAEMEERKRREEQQSEDDLQRALRLSEEEAKKQKQKELEKDQIDFFSPVQEINPIIQVVQNNPYQEWQQQQFFIQQQQQQTYLIQQQQQQQLLLEQQQQQQRVLQQQLEFERAQQRQREMEMFAQAQARAQAEAQAKAQAEAMARAQAEAQVRAQAEMFAQMNTTASNPFGVASRNGVSLNLIDQHEPVKTDFNFQSTNATIDPFATVGTRTNALSSKKETTAGNPFGTGISPNKLNSAPRSQVQDDLLSLDPLGQGFGNVESSSFRFGSSNSIQNRPIQPQSTGFSAFSGGIPAQPTGFIRPAMPTISSSTGGGMMNPNDKNNVFGAMQGSNNLNSAFQQAAGQESSVFGLNSQSKNPFAAKTNSSPFAPRNTATNNNNNNNKSVAPTLSQLQNQNTGAGAIQSFNSQAQQRNMF